MKTESANNDTCGRCKARHGGNNHTCPVHGQVSAGCCEPPCNPEEWTGHTAETHVSGQPPRKKGES